MAELKVGPHTVLAIAADDREDSIGGIVGLKPSDESAHKSGEK
jgi:hypothetical protein